MSLFNDRCTFNQDGVEAGITASTDSAQGSVGDADVITEGVNIVGTVASAGDSLTLPYGARIGSTVTVKNQAANSMDLFPALADTINGGTANAALAITNDFAKTLVKTTALNWEVIASSDDSP